MIATSRATTMVVTQPKRTNIESQCVAKGMRMTEQRRIIARVLSDSVDHPDVEELYRRCSGIDDRISISTVYRTVQLFEDAGINLRTGEVIEFQSEEIEQLQSEIARKLGYRLIDHRLELYAIPAVTKA